MTGAWPPFAALGDFTGSTSLGGYFMHTVSAPHAFLSETTPPRTSSGPSLQRHWLGGVRRCLGSLQVSCCVITPPAPRLAVRGPRGSEGQAYTCLLQVTAVLAAVHALAHVLARGQGARGLPPACLTVLPHGGASSQVPSSVLGATSPALPLSLSPSASLALSFPSRYVHSPVSGLGARAEDCNPRTVAGGPDHSLAAAFLALLGSRALFSADSAAAFSSVGHRGGPGH